MNRRTAAVHIVGYGTFALVWLGLVILTGTTVTVAGINLGTWNILAALIIASVKAGLVLSYFMHLKYEEGIFKVMFLVALVTLAVIVGLTFSDVFYRSAPQ